jgi:tetratricopeptide (TPR) repeat protein
MLQQALALDPADPKGHLLLAKAYLAVGEEDKAAEHRQIAQQVINAVQGAEPLQAEVLKVQMLLKNQRLADAQKQAQNLAQAHPEDWRGHYACGLVCLSQGEPLEALELFHKAEAAGGQSAGLFISLAEAYTLNEDAPNALAWAKKAVRLEPHDPGPRLAMAAVLRSFGYISQAVREEEVAESLQHDAAGDQS